MTTTKKQPIDFEYRKHNATTGRRKMLVRPTSPDECFYYGCTPGTMTIANADNHSNIEDGDYVDDGGQGSVMFSIDELIATNYELGAEAMRHGLRQCGFTFACGSLIACDPDTHRQVAYEIPNSKWFVHDPDTKEERPYHDWKDSLTSKAHFLEGSVIKNVMDNADGTITLVIRPKRS